MMLICLQLPLLPLWWNDDTTHYKLENHHSTCLSSFANSSESRVCSKQNAHAVINKKHNQITSTEKLSLHMFCAIVSIKSPEQKIYHLHMFCASFNQITRAKSNHVHVFCATVSIKSPKRKIIIKHLKDTRS